MRVLVIGATGTQGGSVIEALLSGEYGEFADRGPTHDATSSVTSRLRKSGWW